MDELVPPSGRAHAQSGDGAERGMQAEAVGIASHPVAGAAGAAAMAELERHRFFRVAGHDQDRRVERARAELEPGDIAGREPQAGGGGRAERGRVVPGELGDRAGVAPAARARRRSGRRRPRASLEGELERPIAEMAAEMAARSIARSSASASSRPEA